MSITLGAPTLTSCYSALDFGRELASWIRPIHSLNTKDVNAMRKTIEKSLAEVKCLSRICAKLRPYQVKCLSNDDDAN